MIQIFLVKFLHINIYFDIYFNIYFLRKFSILWEGGGKDDFFGEFSIIEGWEGKKCLEERFPNRINGSPLMLINL